MTGKPAPGTTRNSSEPIMAFHKLLRPSVGTDNAHEQNNPDLRRGRFIAPTADLSASAGYFYFRMNLLTCIIAPTADLSALDGWSVVRMKYSMCIIGPLRFSRSPDEFVNLHYRPSLHVLMSTLISNVRPQEKNYHFSQQTTNLVHRFEITTSFSNGT